MDRISDGSQVLERRFRQLAETMEFIGDIYTEIYANNKKQGHY